MKKDDDRHCSECKHYEICTNFYMYCKVLKRRITARKKPCKHYESFIRKQKMKKSLDEIEAGDEVYYTSRYYSKILKVLLQLLSFVEAKSLESKMVARYRQIHGVVVTFQYLLKV